VAEIRGELGEAVESAHRRRGELTLTVRREEIARAAACLKGRFRYSSLVDLCAADEPARQRRFTVVYQLWSLRDNRPLRLRLETDEQDPVPSVTGVWPGAAWPEREAWDLYGVRFSGHPGLARLLLWEGFGGHPLRKDFPLAGMATGGPPADHRGEEPPEGTLELAFGPHHPALHGLLRLRVRLDGESIASCEPQIGYLHRGTEKLFEAQPLARNLAYTDRLDFAAAATTNLAYSAAVEKLLGLAVPRRARLVRTLLAELQRIASHLLWLATSTHDLGAVGTMSLCLHEREAVLDLFERYCGARLTLSCICPGGLPFDLPAGPPRQPAPGAPPTGSGPPGSVSWTGAWTERCQALLTRLQAGLDEIEERLEGDRGWKKRTVGVGVLGPEAALDHGVTGPMLRACGVDFDLRKALPYEAYGEMEFDVPLGQNGDAYDRYRVRLGEMRQSRRIAGQCLERLAGLGQGAAAGPVLADLPQVLAAPAGVAVYHGVEGPRGEIGFYLAGDGTPNLARCHVRAPSYHNLQALPELARDHAPADLLAILSSMDIAMGEVDR
jgi:NADH-quinone oxidoreductase subunit C/D